MVLWINGITIRYFYGYRQTGLLTKEGQRGTSTQRKIANDWWQYTWGCKVQAPDNQLTGEEIRAVSYLGVNVTLSAQTPASLRACDFTAAKDCPPGPALKLSPPFSSSANAEAQEGRKCSVLPKPKETPSPGGSGGGWCLLWGCIVPSMVGLQVLHYW